MSVSPVPNRLVALTFDDGAKSDVTFVAPLLKQYGFGATFFITEGLNFLDNKERRLTWDEVRRLDEAGFEVGNHTSDHVLVDTQTPEEFRKAVEHIESRCDEYRIKAPISFCYPAWRNSKEAVSVLQNMGYRFARRGVAPEFPESTGRGRAYDPAQDHPLLIPTTGSSGPDWQLEDFIAAVEQARDGKIAVLTFHGVPDPDHPWVHTERDVFETCMQYLDANGYRAVALRDLEDYVDPTAMSDDPYASIERWMASAKSTAAR